ncbi:hypothetical protein [Arthrobacter polaris]
MGTISPLLMVMFMSIDAKFVSGTVSLNMTLTFLSVIFGRLCWAHSVP